MQNLPKSFTLPDEYFDTRVSMSRREIEDIRDVSLRKTYALCWKKVPLYQKKFREYGLTRDSIKGLADLPKIPFTNPDEIRTTEDNSRTSLELLAVPLREVCLVHSSSGTTGRCKVFAYNGSDIVNWASNVAVCFWIMGFRKEDIYICWMPFGEFTGGGSMYFGATMVGMTYIPITIGPGMTEKIIMHLTGQRRLGDKVFPMDPLLVADSFGGTSSFALRVAEKMEELNIDFSSLKLKRATFGGEPMSEALRKKIEARFNVDVRDMYGLGEFFGAGVAAECETKDGLHLVSDSMIAEILNPQTQKPVQVGEWGELVLTGLTKAAMPLLRYRTGDLLQRVEERCPCGIAHQKIGRIIGRIDRDELYLTGGIKMDKTFLEEMIFSEKEVGSEYVLVAPDYEKKAARKLHIIIEALTEKAGFEQIETSIARKVETEYNFNPSVTCVRQGTLPRNFGKARRLLNYEEAKDILSKLEGSK